MQQLSGITVEEVGLDEWLHTAFRAQRAPRPYAVRRRSPRRPAATRAAARLFGARPLYWSWFAGAALSLLLHAT